MRGILFDLGFIKIYWYSVLIFIALLAAGYLILKESKKWKIPEDFIINLFFFAIPISIIGARLYFVAFHWDYYGSNLIDIIKIWEGGLAIHGGIITGLLWVIYYSKKYKVNTLRLLDIIVVGLIIGQAIGRWGNFFNGEAHGPVTTIDFLHHLLLPNFIIEGMNINGVYYQPTFLYESIWCLIGFVAMLYIRKYRYLKIGQLTSFYMMWYGMGRLWIETLRTDSLMIGPLKMAQLVSALMVILGMILFMKFNKGSKFDNQYNDEENTDEVRF